MSEYVGARVDKELKAKAEKKSRGIGLSLSDVIRLLLFRWVKDNVTLIDERKESHEND